MTIPLLHRGRTRSEKRVREASRERVDGERERESRPVQTAWPAGWCGSLVQPPILSHPQAGRSFPTAHWRGRFIISQQHAHTHTHTRHGAAPRIRERERGLERKREREPFLNLRLMTQLTSCVLIGRAGFQSELLLTCVLLDCEHWWERESLPLPLSFSLSVCHFIRMYSQFFLQDIPIYLP